MEEPLILAVESSGRMGAVAIATGSRILSEQCFSAPMRHSMEVFQATEDLLRAIGRKASEIGHIYISAGPGSFTGLRIATTMAKIMNLAGGVKIVAVDTLDVIAANCSQYKTDKGKVPEKTASILDAKRGEFFTAVYQRAANQGYSNSPGKDDSAPAGVFNWKKIAPDCVMTAEDFVEKFGKSRQPIWLSGEGLVYYRDKFKAEGFRFLPEQYWSPTASKVHMLGWQMALEGRFNEAGPLRPTYLRGADVRVKR
ncbi:MAG TPA: tRNA (adenosine(37)-N6)-threonylcarbamoyltransferase complex dimerization subunit type 1 TsaB [Sedimentisphaerales bacterium]|nr:tRNA (adenosine(37)-N6)-threonylcarbamoyltransferase complex dimerization subunit type 1 TsaB [Sedimentisphaerales bacterium]